MFFENYVLENLSIIFKYIYFAFFYERAYSISLRKGKMWNSEEIWNNSDSSRYDAPRWTFQNSNTSYKPKWNLPRVEEIKIYGF